jgi:hypothetical protein
VPVSRLSGRTYRAASLPAGYTEDFIVEGVEFGADYISVPPGTEIFIDHDQPHVVSVWRGPVRVARVACMGTFSFNPALNPVVPDDDGDVELTQGDYSLVPQHQGLAWAWLRLSL